MNQPTLYSKRLILQPAQSEDAVSLQALWSRPEVRRYLFDNKDVSLQLAESVLNSALDCASSGYGMWLIYQPHQTELLGCIGLMPAETAAQYEPTLAGLLEPIVALAVEHWHKGYANEALAKVLTYAFETLEQPSLCAVNDVPNVASERMLKKIGFTIVSEVQGPEYKLRTYLLQRDKSSAI